MSLRFRTIAAGLACLALLSAAGLACSLFSSPPTAAPAPAEPSPTQTAPSPAIQHTVAPTRTAAPPSPTPSPAPSGPPFSARLEEHGRRDLPASAALQVVFDQPINPGSADLALLTYPYVPAELSWDDSRTRLTFRPTAGFAPDRDYRLFLNSALRSAADGAPEQTALWELHTRPAPQVSGVSPLSGELSDLQPQIELAFSAQMDAAAVEAALTINPPVPFRLEWRSPQAAALTFDEPLVPGVKYVLHLSAAARDQNGVPLAGESRWEYRVKPLVAGFAGPTSDDLGEPLRISFNYQLKKASFLENARLLDPADQRVPGRWEWTTALQARFLPDEDLLPGRQYHLAFTGKLETVAGLALKDVPAAAYQSPPPVLVAFPNEDGASPGSTVSIRFSIPVHQPSVESSFHLEPAVEGSFTWRDNTLIFTPADSLQAYTQYTARIDTSARAADGSPLLLEPFAWSFYVAPRTSFETAGVSFGEYGPNAQVLDFDGRRALQFLAWETGSVTFELYRLTLEQFLERYSSNFRGVVGFESAPIPLDGAALQKRWEQPISGRGWGYQTNIYEAVIPGDVPAGLYVLNLSTSGSNVQLILVLTRNTLVLKQAGDQISAWAADVNGAPRPRVRIGVYARDGQRLAQGRADDNGFYTARVGRDPAPLIVIAEDSTDLTGRAIEGTDITVSGLGSEWQSGRSWYGWWEPQAPAETISAHIHTDRPIYRPGQTVYYKAILRLDDDALLSLPPEGTPVTVRLRDARQNVVTTEELQTNAYGSVYGRFVIAEGAMTGSYQVEVAAAGGSIKQRFKVQDYAKPDYEVQVSTQAEHYVAGDTVRASISARYYYDQPVASPARATARLYELSSQYYYWFSEPDPADDPYHWSPVWDFTEHTVTLDENGLAQFELDAPTVEEYSPYWYDNRWSNQRTRRLGLEVTVEDPSGQSVSSFAVFTVHNAAETLELDAGGYLRRPQQAFSVRGWQRSLEGEPLAGRSLTLEVRGHSASWYDFDTIVQTYQAQTGADGLAEFQVTIDSPGFYQLRLNGADPSGKPTYISDWVYVTASGARWVTEYIQDLAITAESETYAPGETARLVIESSFSGPALLTFERGSVRRAQVVELTAPLTLVETPILETDVPNIYVTVNAWSAQDTDFSKLGEYGSETSLSDARLRTSTVQITVPAQGKGLEVVITPEKPVYAPAETALVTLQVTDESGSPVQAELSLAVVDEAIYALSEDLSPPILTAFYGPRRNRVRTYDSMQPSRLLMAFGRGGGGGDGGGALRANFPDTAVWLPVLLTDENGRVVVELPLPDNLTTWRLTARAASQDHRFGQAAASLVTQKPVVVRPLLPRTLTQGDSLLLSTQVHNYTTQPLTLDLSLRTSLSSTDTSAPPAFELLDPPTQTVTLQPSQSLVVGWQARSLQAGEAYVTVLAFLPPENGQRKLADGVVLPLEVRPLAVLDLVTLSGEFTGAYETVLPLPSGVLDTSTVQIELSRSVAGGLLEGLQQLTGYPYGCVEQTMSRALPNAVVGRAFSQLGAGKLGANPDLPGLVNAGLQRLYGYQHDDGGWGWWFDDSTDDYQSAWVVFGLAVTAEAGFEVDPQVIDRGAEYLQRALKKDLEQRTRAYMLYALAYAGYGDLPASLELYEGRAALDTFSQAALALALQRLEARLQAETILNELAESAVITDELVYWPNAAEDGHYHDKTMSSTLRSTALALDAFVRIQPGHALEPGIVRYLMSVRRPDGWGSTNETSYAILALTDHLLSVEAASADTPYEVLLDGLPLASGVLGRGEPAVQIELSIKDFAANSAPRLVFSTGTGLRLYYHITSRMLFPQADLPAAGRVMVSRAYVHPVTGQPLDSIQSGDLVKVVLTVDLDQPAFFFLVEDKLPGGFEALNESLNTTSHAQELYDAGYQLYFWQELGYNFKEVRSERVTFFITELQSGSYTYTYLARAVRAGEFTVLPAEAYAMYNEALWGRSPSDRLTVAPRLE